MKNPLRALCAALSLAASTLIAQPFTLETSQVNVAVAPGFDHTNVGVVVTAGGPGFDIGLLQVTSDSAWVTPSVDTGSGEVVLTFTTAGLTNSSYTATISVTHGANSAAFYVSAACAPLNIFKLTDDPVRSRTYGLQHQALNRGSVVILDPITGAKLGNVTVGRKPTGMTFSNDGSELLVINSVDKSISVIDLATLEIKQTIPLPAYTSGDLEDTTANIGTGPGNILYYTDGAWAPPLRVFNRSTGTVLQTVFIDPTSGNGFGDFGLNSGKTELYGWAQYGWNAGWAGSYVSKFSVAPSGLLTFVESTNSVYPTPLGRDPLETPVLVSNDSATVFIKKWGFSPEAISTLKHTFSGDVYSISPGGEIAATSSTIYDVLTGSPLHTLPFTTTVQAITSDYSRMVLFSQATRTFQFVDLYAAIGPQMLGRTLTPADGSIVLPPSTLQWSPLPGVDSYRVYLGTSSSAVTAASTASAEYKGLVNSPSFTVPDPLAPGVTYYWRVDSVTSAGVSAGAVYSFRVSPVSSSRSSLHLATVRGHASLKATLALDSLSTGTAWQASADQSWVTFTQSSGVTPANLEVVLNASAHPVGLQTATVTLSNLNGTLFTLPVRLKVDPLVLTVIKSDPLSKFVYAVSEDVAEDIPAAYLLEIDSQDQTIARVVPVGSSVTDLALHNADNRVYVTNWRTGSVRAINKTTFAEERTYAFSPAASSGYGGGDAYRISAGGPGRLVVEEQDQWIDISIFNTATGAKMGTTYRREGGGAFDPTGRYYYHGDNNISNAEIRKLDVTGDVFSELAHTRVQSYSYYGSRVVVVSESGNRVFWNGSCFDASLVEQWSLAKEVYATTPDGRYAFGETEIFDTVLKNVVAGMPATTRVSAFNSTSNKLVVQDGGGLGFYPLTAFLSLPAPVLAGTAGLSSAILTWTDTSLETGFTLQRRLEGTSAWTDVTPFPGQNVLTATVSGLAGGTAYEFRLKADSPAASSNWSNIVTVTPSSMAPSAPYLYSPLLTASSAQLSWTDSGSETGYVVERSPRGFISWVTVGSVGHNVLGYTDESVTSGTSYSYRVKASFGAQGPLYSNVRSVTIPTQAAWAPLTPSNPVALVVTFGHIRFTWSNVQDETGYRIERWDDAAGMWTVLANLPADTTVLDDDTVQAGVQYWYRVQAVNDAGSSAFSREASVTAPQEAVMQPDPSRPYDVHLAQANAGYAYFIGAGQTLMAQSYQSGELANYYYELHMEAGDPATAWLQYYTYKGKSLKLQYASRGKSKLGRYFENLNLALGYKKYFTINNNPRQAKRFYDKYMKIARASR